MCLLCQWIFQCFIHSAREGYCDVFRVWDFLFFIKCIFLFSAHVWESEDNLQESVSRTKLESPDLSAECLHMQSHLTGPDSSVLTITHRAALKNHSIHFILTYIFSLTVVAHTCNQNLDAEAGRLSQLFRSLLSYIVSSRLAWGFVVTT